MTRGLKNKENKNNLMKSRKLKKNQVTNPKELLKIKIRKMKPKMILMFNQLRKSILKPSQQKNLVPNSQLKSNQVNHLSKAKPKMKMTKSLSLKPRPKRKVKSHYPLTLKKLNQLKVVKKKKLKMIKILKELRLLIKKVNQNRKRLLTALIKKIPWIEKLINLVICLSTWSRLVSTKLHPM